MNLTLFHRNVPTRARKATSTRRTFQLEGLEERTVMTATAVAHVAPMPAAQVAPAAHNSVSVPISITGLNLTGVTTNSTTGLITGLTGTVSGTINGLPFSGAPLTITPGAASTAAVPVLDLHLGPIDLNLLGLEVKTSEICLNVTAQPGPGNLLGNLVGGLANALNGTLSATGVTGLNGVIGGITGTAGTATSQTAALGTLGSLLSPPPTGAASNASLLGLLNAGTSSALGSMTPAATAAPTSTVDNLVHLTVGPLNLNLLGLDVKLDNCAGGPVTVDVNAISGSGDLLGNLLTGVAHLLDTPGHGAGALSKLDTEILTLIKGL